MKSAKRLTLNGTATRENRFGRTGAYSARSFLCHELRESKLKLKNTTRKQNSMAWSLSQLLAGLHDDIEHKLKTARRSFEHPGTKGNASEEVWLELLNTYLP